MLIIHTAGSFNGRTEDFGSSNLGSIPSPAARLSGEQTEVPQKP